MNILYAISIILLMTIFFYFIYKNRHSFFYLWLNFLSFTHIVGIIYMEYGGKGELREGQEINGASIIYLISIILINFLFSKNLTYFKFPLSFNDKFYNKAWHRQPILIYTLVYVVILSIAINGYVLIFTTAPLLAGATDVIRADGIDVPGFFYFFAKTLLPISAGVLILLNRYTKKYSMKIMVDILIIASVILYPILMAHKSLLFTSLFFILISLSLFYGYKKIKYYYVVIACLILSYMIFMMNMHLQGQDNNIADRFIYRLFIAQGSNFYVIWDDYLHDKLPYLYDFSFLTFAFQSSMLSFLGDFFIPVHEEGFEYMLTLHYTSDWFASHWNLVSTFLGEPIFSFGLAGFLFIIFIYIYIKIIHFFLKRFFLKKDIASLALCYYFINLLNGIWNMGSYFTLFSISTIVYGIVIYAWFFPFRYIYRK